MTYLAVEKRDNLRDARFQFLYLRIEHVTHETWLTQLLPAQSVETRNTCDVRGPTPVPWDRARHITQFLPGKKCKTGVKA